MAKDFDTSINERVKIIRKELKLTQAQFSNRLETQQSYYSEIERGNRELNSRMLQALIVEFDVSSDWLLTGEGEKFIKKNEGGIITESDNDYQNWDTIEKLYGKNDELEDRYSRPLFSVQDLMAFYDAIESNEELNRVWSNGSKISNYSTQFNLFIKHFYNKPMSDLMTDYKLTYKKRTSNDKFYSQNKSTIHALISLNPILESAIKDFNVLLRNLKKIDQENILGVYFSSKDFLKDD